MPAATRTTPGHTDTRLNRRRTPGVLASYKFSDLVSASVGIANTVGPMINEQAWLASGYQKAESYKTYMGSIALTAPESMGFLAGSTLVWRRGERI